MKFKTILLYFALRLSIAFLIFSILVRLAYAEPQVRVLDSLEEYAGEPQELPYSYYIEGELTWEHVQQVQKLQQYGTIKITSPGGSILYFREIAREIEKKDLNVICIEYCGSAAALIYQVAKTHVDQKEGATLAFHSPGQYTSDGRWVFNPLPEYQRMYKDLGVDKLMTKKQWDVMWTDGQAVIEVEVK